MDFITGFGFAANIASFAQLIGENIKKSDAEWQGLLRLLEKLLKKYAEIIEALLKQATTAERFLFLIITRTCYIQMSLML